MKQKNKFSTIIIFSLLFILACRTVLAQVDANDPFRGNHLLGASSEIILMRAAEDGGPLFGTIFDANGAIDVGGLSASTTQSEDGVFQFPGDRAQLDVATADFNDDGFDEFVVVWEGEDRSINMFIPEIEPATLSWSKVNRVTVQDGGFPPLFDIDDFFLRRWIRITTGQFDDDPEKEFALAYFAEDTETGGPIQIIIYDTDGTLVPKVMDSIADERLEPFKIANSNHLQRSSVFDITTGDFDQDGTDEITIMAVEPGELDSNGNRIGWKLYAKVYDVVDGLITPKARSEQPIFDEPFNSADFLFRLVIASGDFNGDLFDEVVFGWEMSPTNVKQFEIGLQVLTVSSDLESVVPVGPTQFRSSGRGQDGWPMSITTGDVDLDGKDEIIHASRNDIRVYKADDQLQIGSSSIASVSISTDENEVFHRTVALTDLDITDGDSLETEIIIAEVFENEESENTARIRVFQSHPAEDGLNLDSQPTAEFTTEFIGAPLVLAMAVGDFDGDSVRLGPPTRQTVTDIVQPLVILNAPPIHFDTISGQHFDINKCFNNDPGVECEHRAIYENATTVETEVSTEVTADWGVSQSLTAEVGAEIGPIEASVTGTLKRKYGERFSNIEGSSQTVTVKVTSNAIEDDRLYATISDNEILEYPVLANNELHGHVVAVVPKLIGIEGLQNTWFSGKSSRSRTHLSSHEVANLFSYRDVADVPEGARLFGRGGFQGGGGDSWELSGTSKQTWELRFGSEEITERESSSFQQVSRSLSAEVSGGFGPIQASLSGTVKDKYGSKEISTHKSFVKEESAVIVDFGTIDQSILGTKTYTVSPYVYWASNGALVLDYAVNLDVSAGVPSWWEENYGSKSDLSFILPWRNDEAKGIASTNPAVQREETRDIIFNPLNPVPGDVVTISARIQNYSLKDQLGSSIIRFFIGDPGNRGTLIVNENGQSEVNIPPINSRKFAVASLENWKVPGQVSKDTKIYAVIDPDNEIDEIHEDNNKAWNLLNPNSGISGPIITPVPTGSPIVTPTPTPTGTIEPNPSPTPNTTPPGKSFVFECAEDLIEGPLGAERLVLEVGEIESCTLKLINAKSGVPVKVLTKQRKMIGQSITIEPSGNATDSDGTLTFNIKAVQKGTVWATWAVPNDQGNHEFNRNAYEEGFNWGMIVEVK